MLPTLVLEAESRRAAHGDAYSASSGVSRISWQASETISCRFSQLQRAGVEVGGERDGRAGVQELPRRRVVVCSV